MNYKFGDTVWYNGCKAIIMEEKDCYGKYEIRFPDNSWLTVRENTIAPRLQEAQKCWVRNFGDEKFKEAQFLNMENKKFRVVPKGGGGMLFDDIRLINPYQSTLDEIKELKERIKELEAKLIEI